MLDNPHRHFDLVGASNFRDLGGYLARAGRRLRWRRIFRSSHLGHLTDADIAALRDLGLKSVFDLRGVEERVAAECRADGLAVHSLPIEPAVITAVKARLAGAEPLSGMAAAELMRESY